MFISAPTQVGKIAPTFSENPAHDVTPSDGTDLPTGPQGNTCRGVQVTGAGNVAVNLLDGGTATLTGLSAGQRLNIDITRVLSTGTTATGIRALY